MRAYSDVSLIFFKWCLCQKKLRMLLTWVVQMSKYCTNLGEDTIKCQHCIKCSATILTTPLRVQAKRFVSSGESSSLLNSSTLCVLCSSIFTGNESLIVQRKRGWVLCDTQTAAVGSEWVVRLAHTHQKCERGGNNIAYVHTPICARKDLPSQLLDGACVIQRQ